MYNPLSQSDSKENRPNLAHLRTVVEAEHSQDVEDSVYYVDQIPGHEDYNQPQAEPEQAKVIEFPQGDVAKVAITGTTKSPDVDLALQRVFEIHEEAA
jgi:hypothetical protein